MGKHRSEKYKGRAIPLLETAVRRPSWIKFSVYLGID